MTDIVGRLRERERHTNLGVSDGDVFREAADEIERLRSALSYCVAAHQTGRFEPAQVACENAKNVLEGITND